MLEMELCQVSHEILELHDKMLKITGKDGRDDWEVCQRDKVWDAAGHLTDPLKKKDRSPFPPASF